MAPLSELQLVRIILTRDEPSQRFATDAEISGQCDYGNSALESNQFKGILI